MKILHKIVALLLIFVLMYTSSGYVFAHQQMLNIEYDDCEVPIDDSGNITNTDGEDETWYWLEWYGSEYHISHTVETIKYYFSDISMDGSSYTWTTDITETEANEIKEAIANSMEKWNDIYYFSYDESGKLISHKVINIVEGSKNDCNLIIYPTQSTSFAAQVFYSDETINVLETKYNGNTHYHPENWWMEVSIASFVTSNPLFNMFRERTGQHEVGHILGIYDVDVCCSATAMGYHHEEILMGYGYENRATRAQYKDIAGVAITRGFHDDDDHVWMLRTNSDGTKDIICAQCNGVRYNITVSIDANNALTYEGKQLNIYKSCVHHGGTNENMLLVATDGIRDFYKCQYCRYMKENSHTHNYVSIDDNYHTYSCYCATEETPNINHSLYVDDITNGLHTLKCADCSYTITEEHNTMTQAVSGNQHASECWDCGYIDESTREAHSFDGWVFISETMHMSRCECGARGTTTAPHGFVPLIGSIDRKVCAGCGYTKTFGSDGGFIIMSNTKVSLNGSYILPDGNIVLVDEDVEAYLNGTLVFYDKDKLPITQ